MKQKKAISAVWLVPLLALLLAAWLGFQAWQQAGPTIEIRFAQASGIKVGKTEIRYKDVRIGIVRDVELDEDLNKVLVSAEMDPEVKEYLTDNSRFWLVEPTVGFKGVTGLETLLSGVYIAMDPGEPGNQQYRFDALATPPAVQSTDTGTSFKLQADSLDSLNIGSPVYYRKVPVGEVTGYRLYEDGTGVEIKVFIEAPYDGWVSSATRFWNASGFGMELNAQGMKANMASVVSLLAGGIEFKTPELNASDGNARDYALASSDSQPAKEGQEFTLFPDEKAIEEEVYTLRYNYLMRFSDSVRGLEVGAPVELRGIKVGSVVDIRFLSGQQHIQVAVALEPQRLDVDFIPSREEMDALMKERVANGLKAQLKTGNLITGALFVDLFEDTGNAGEMRKDGRWPIIPTSAAQLDQVMSKLNNLLEKLNSFPLQTIGEDLQQSLEALNSMLQQLKRQQTAGKVDKLVSNLEVSSRGLETVVANANEAIIQAEQSLNSINQNLSPDSQLHYQSLQLIEQLQRAAQAVRILAEELNRNPNALLFGKDKRDAP